MTRKDKIEELIKSVKTTDDIKAKCDTLLAEIYKVPMEKGFITKDEAKVLSDEFIPKLLVATHDMLYGEMDKLVKDEEIDHLLEFHRKCPWGIAKILDFSLAIQIAGDDSISKLMSDVFGKFEKKKKEELTKKALEEAKKKAVEEGEKGEKDKAKC